MGTYLEIFWKELWSDNNKYVHRDNDKDDCYECS